VLSGSIIRGLVIAAFFVGASMSGTFEGLPWWFDGWVALPRQ